ncbi:hypothetical protein HC007_00535 [Limosilactobacillus fermentum]
MTTSNWNILSVFASIISVYISYLLGKKASNMKFEQKQKMKRYDSLYAPLMKLLYSRKSNDLVFYNLIISNQFESFEKLLIGNVQYMGKESAQLLYKVMTTGKSEVIKQNKKNLFLINNGMKLQPMDDKAAEAIDLYRDLIIRLLLESVDLSKSLHLESIGQPLIDIFQKEGKYLDK